MNKLNLKISLLMGILSFLIAFTIGTYSNNITTQQLEKNSGENLIKLSKNIANTLDKEMLERYREIKFAASVYPMTNESSTKEERREFIEKIKNNYNHHEWIGYALPDGTVDVGTKGYLEGKNVKARPWHPAGLKGPYIGDVHDALLLAKLLPNTSGEAIYFSDIAFPVKNSQGKVLGTLCTHLMWQWTRDVIRGIEKENDIDIFLLSNDGLILVGPNNTERKEITDISLNAANFLKDSIDSSYKVFKWNQNNVYLTATTTSKGFKEYKGFNWKVIVRQPVEEAFNNSKKNSLNIFLASIITAIIGAIIGIFFSSKLISPIIHLNKIVKKLANGEKVTFEKTNSKDEISNLHNAIKDLFTNLNTTSDIKNKAQDRVKISLQVFDQSIEGILITDKNNNSILTNKAFEKITGYSQEDMYGKNPNILGSGATSKEFYKNLWSQLQKEGKWEGNILNKRKDGKIYKEYLRISTLKDQHGNIVNYVATFLGIDELIQDII